MPRHQTLLLESKICSKTSHPNPGQRTLHLDSDFCYWAADPILKQRWWACSPGENCPQPPEGVGFPTPPSETATIKAPTIALILSAIPNPGITTKSEKKTMALVMILRWSSVECFTVEGSGCAGKYRPSHMTLYLYLKPYS